MILDALKKCELFSELTDSELRQVCDVVRERVVLAGKPIIEEGAEAFSLFAIETGSVDILKSGEDGTRPRITELIEGSIFGEIALLDHALRSAQVVAHSDATILELKYIDLEALAAAFPTIGCKFYKAMAYGLSRKTRKTTEDLVSLIGASKKAALGELTKTIGHEVKTPLTSIVLNLDMLERLVRSASIDQSLVEERMAVIRVAVQRLVKIIDGLDDGGKDTCEGSIATANVPEEPEETFSPKN